VTARFRRGPAGVHLPLEDRSRLGGWKVAFLAGERPAPELAGVEELCRQPGVFLFLRAYPADAAAFADRVRRYLGIARRPGLAFAWIDDPEGDPPRWSRRPLLFAYPDLLRTTAPASVQLPNYALVVGGGCALSLADDTLTLSPAGVGGIYLASQYGAALFPVPYVAIPLSGEDAGACVFEVPTDTAQGFAALGIGLRYSMNDPAWPGWGRLRSLELPLAADPVGVTLTVSIGAEWTMQFTGPSPAAFQSAFMGFGGPVTLAPSATAGFVAATVPPGATPGPYDPVYFTPSGAFTVAGVGTTGPLLGGLAGGEYFTGAGALEFVPGQPAYAPSLGAAATPGASGLAGPATTSYVSVSGDALQYFTQPKGNSFFIPSGTALVLDYLPIPGAPGPGPYPMAAFAGVSADDAPFAKALEHQVLSPARLQAVAATPQAPDGAPLTAALPSGLLASWASAADPAYDLSFGQNNGAELTFSGVTGALQAALQASQLFLVISDLGALSGCLAPASPPSSSLPSPLVVDTPSFGGSWTFDLFNADQWESDAQPTVLVFKFAAGALGDLVANLDAWTAAGTFVGGTAPAAQAVVQAAIAQARQAYGAGAKEFAYFVDTVVQDPEWTGLIFFNVAVPVPALPEPLQAGTGGAAELLAHHFGFSVTPITAASAGLAFAGDSTLFGVVAYAAAADLTYGSTPYAFQLQALTLLFQSSALVSHSVQVEVLVCEIFGEQATLQGGPHGNNLLLDGGYQADGTFAFALSPGSAARFTMGSAVLDTVTVTAAQLVEAPGGAGAWQFVLAGSLSFQTFTGPYGAFDLFSFGELAFTGATIGMSVDGPAYAFTGFDAGQMALNLTSSAPRPGSLFRSLPVQPAGFLQVLPPSTATPLSLGYLGVQAAVSQGALAAPWYGLPCTLNLGSAGALAPAGGFVAQLLAAWSPSPWSPGSSEVPQPNVAIGIVFPGTSTAAPTTTTLQGALKLQFGDVALEMEPDGSYVLVVTGIALKLFGIGLPPGGQAAAYFFGAPAAAGSPSIGWYLGYPASGQEG
jgi:hypothetical protein